MSGSARRPECHSHRLGRRPRPAQRWVWHQCRSVPDRLPRRRARRPLAPRNQCPEVHGFSHRSKLLHRGSGAGLQSIDSSQASSHAATGDLQTRAPSRADPLCALPKQTLAPHSHHQSGIPAERVAWCSGARQHRPRFSDNAPPANRLPTPAVAGAAHRWPAIICQRAGPAHQMCSLNAARDQWKQSTYRSVTECVALHRARLDATAGFRRSARR